MLERTRNAVTGRAYEIVREGHPEAVGRFRRLHEADREARVRARVARRGEMWLVVQTRRGVRIDVVRRIAGGHPPEGGDEAGDRFPRRPLRPRGAGAVALPLPDD
jgi:hypothetical protein